MSVQTIKQRFGIIGNAAGLDYAISVAERVAPTDLTVLITGESGVGKEVFSKIIHQLSARKHNKFIAINCGAIPDGTIDSELFGHEKGAFTGASDKRKGYFETVDGGTIFLDEIGEMPVGTQARLLRVLEAGEYIKVGASQVQKTNVRIVAATNVNLLEKVSKGKFREDLYYRLSTVPIEIPPLRERGDDVALLFRKFASDFTEKNRIERVRLDDNAQRFIINYSWPGNVRQLKNIAEQVTILSTAQQIGIEDLKRVIPEITKRNLPSVYQNQAGETHTERELLYKLFFDLKKDINDIKQYLFRFSNGKMPPPPHENEPRVDVHTPALPNPHEKEIPTSDFEEEQFVHSKVHEPIILNDEHTFEESETVEESLSLEEMEKELIKKALSKHNGKRKYAAVDLGISERTLYRKIKEYGI